MKTAAKIRIVVWSAVAIVLLCLMLTVMKSGGFGRFSIWNPTRVFGGSNNYHEYADSEMYSVGGATVNPSAVSQIDIDWIDGNVTVIVGAGNEISFNETSSYALDDNYRLHYYVNNGRLRIQYCKSRVPLIGMWGSLDKDLTITVPANHPLSAFSIDAVSSKVTYEGVNADSIKLDTVSGALSVSNVTCDKLTADGVSGRVSMDMVNANSLKVNTVSGSVEIEDSAIGEVTCDTVSGSILVEPGANAKEVRGNTVSGSLRVRLPENEGFKARHSSASGGFNCEFPTTSSGSNIATYKNGGMDINLSSVSGSLKIENIG